MNIYVLALDSVFDTGLATVLDALTTANELAAMTGMDSISFKVSVVGVRKRVKTSQGLQVPLVDDTGIAPDWVVVPAIGFKMPEPLVNALERPDVADASERLRQWAAAGSQIAAACIGTFVLAESGLLAGHEATTTWWLAPLFRQRYPEVRLTESHMVVRSGAFITAGAALSHIDMALTLIRQISPELAAMTAKYLVVDTRPSQSTFIINDHLCHNDPMISAFERWARANLSEGFSLDEAAAVLATSKRTLARRMQDVMGKTPLAFFQDLRVERAVHLLKTSNVNIEAIAAEVGYADGVTLRTLLRRRLGQGVKEIRGAL